MGTGAPSPSLMDDHRQRCDPARARSIGYSTDMRTCCGGRDEGDPPRKNAAQEHQPTAPGKVRRRRHKEIEGRRQKVRGFQQRAPVVARAEVGHPSGRHQ